MNTSLFRQEAIQFQHGSRLGEIHIAAPPTAKWLAVLAFLIIGIVAAVLFFGTYTPHNSVHGRLVPSAGVLRVQAAAVGTVTKVWVHEGSSVRSGDRLVEISGEQDSTTGRTRAMIADQLQRQKEQLVASLATLQMQSKNDNTELRAEQDILRRQRLELVAEIALNRGQAEKMKALLDDIRSLVAKGYTSQIEMQQYDASLTQAQSQGRDFQRQRLEIERQIRVIDGKLADAPQALKLSLGDVRRQIWEIERSQAENELQRGQVLRAGVDGVVTGLQAKVGQAVLASETMLSVLPSGSNLIAEVYVPSKAMGAVAVGDKVKVRYDAFPYDQYGHFDAAITEITRSAMSQRELQDLGMPPQNNSDADTSYRIRMKLAPLGGREDIRLRAGMNLEADLFGRRRRIYQWVLSPIYSTLTSGGGRS